MRKTIMIILDLKRKKLHFTGTDLQSTNHVEQWFAYDKDKLSLFASVEQLMTSNGIAENVVSVERVRRCGVWEDFRITYNVNVIAK